MEAGQVGGIVGDLGGLLGSVIGTYFKNTNGPKERAFVLRCSVICGTAVAKQAVGVNGHFLSM